MKSLLRKNHFGHIFRQFSLNRTTIRLKLTKNLPQNGFPSLRLSCSDKLLGSLSTGLVLACTLLLAAPVLATDKTQREPVTIEADSAMFDERQGQSIYTGHVVITQGGMQIRADEVTVYTEEDALQRIVATGEPVRFRQQREGEKEIHGEARRLDYHADNEHLLLQNQAWLTQGGNRFSGQRIEYDMLRERVTAAQAEDGSQRVKVTIQPKAKSPSPENDQR